MLNTVSLTISFVSASDASSSAASAAVSAWIDLHGRARSRMPSISDAWFSASEKIVAPLPVSAVIAARFAM